MGNLLFSPSGRINSSEFMRGAMILIVLGLLIALSPYISSGLAMVMFAVSLLFIWCWVVLWIKRYHDAGKSGWMCLIPIIIWLIGYGILAQMLPGMIAPELEAELKLEMTEAATEGGLGAIFGMANSETALALSKATTLPVALAHAVWSALIAFLFNGMIKHQPEENQFGHPT